MQPPSASRLFLSLAFGTLAGLLLASSAHAQSVINWGTATFISGDADVAPVSTRLWAYNFGDASVSPTVNGVTFVGYASDTGNSDFTLTTVGSEIYQNSSAFGSSQSFYTSLSAGYQDLLISSTYWSGWSGDTQTMTLQNLTVGASYLIQFWVNDSRGVYHGNSVVNFADTLGHGVDVKFSNGSAQSLGQYVTGTFVASDTTQTIILGPYSPQINAATLGVTAVPEPATTALLLGGVALAGLIVIRLRRKGA